MTEQFTNRRGHTQLVEDDVDVQLSELAAHAEPATARRTKPRRRRHGVRLPWKLITFGMIVVVLGVVVTFELARMSYVHSVDSAKQQFATLVSTEVTAATSSEAISSATLLSIRDKARTISSSLCPGGLLDNYASLYPRAVTAFDDCAEYRTKTEAFVAALGAIADEAAYIERLDALLSPIIQPQADKFAVLSSQQENWQQFVTSLKSSEAPASFQSTHTTLVARASTVASLWIGLVSASNEQDSAAFDASYSKLNKAYAAVRSSADEFETLLGQTQTRLTDAYTNMQ